MVGCYQRVGGASGGIMEGACHRDEQVRNGADGVRSAKTSSTKRCGVVDNVPGDYGRLVVISMLINLGTLSKAMWKDCCTMLYDHNNTSSPTSDLDADIANCYANPQGLVLAPNCQLLNCPNSKVLKSKRTHKTKFIRSIRRAHHRFLAERLNRQYTIHHFFDPSVPTPALYL